MIFEVRFDCRIDAGDIDEALGRLGLHCLALAMDIDLPLMLSAPSNLSIRPIDNGEGEHTIEKSELLNETLAGRPYDYNKLARALRPASLPALLEVLPLICRVLHDQNPRFNEGMFMEWALEGK